MRALGDVPHQETLRPDLLPGLRSVTKQRAIFYFDVDDHLRLVRVLAIFFGGQDHQRAMLQRLSNPE
jgi:plasmid stabilization system protein ParE